MSNNIMTIENRKWLFVRFRMDVSVQGWLRFLVDSSAQLIIVAGHVSLDVKAHEQAAPHFSCLLVRLE